MTASITQLSGAEIYDLIYPEYLSMMSKINQETMQRTMCNSSRVWLGRDDDKVIATWGLIPPTLLSDVAYLWLYTTGHLTSHTFIFVRHSRRIMQLMLEEFPIIVGHTEIINHRGIQWLKWLGAEFSAPISDRMIPFTIKAKQCRQQDLAQSA